jgi:hypothetical protein
MKMPHEKNAFENFRALAKKVVAVPKKEMAKREAAYRSSRKSRSGKPSSGGKSN